MTLTAILRADHEMRILSLTGESNVRSIAALRDDPATSSSNECLRGAVVTGRRASFRDAGMGALCFGRALRSGIPS